MNLDNMIEKLCSELEIPNTLNTQVPGVFALPIDEGLDIVITSAPPGFTLTCEVCDAPKEKETEFLEQAMIANVFGQATENCVLGLSEGGKKVVMSKHVDWSPEFPEFYEIIEDFINAVDFWHGETSSYCS